MTAVRRPGAVGSAPTASGLLADGGAGPARRRAKTAAEVAFWVAFLVFLLTCRTAMSGVIGLALLVATAIAWMMADDAERASS